MPLQSSHCRVSVGVGVPVHVPSLSVSVCPACAAPEMLGGEVFCGVPFELEPNVIRWIVPPTMSA